MGLTALLVRRGAFDGNGPASFQSADSRHIAENSYGSATDCPIVPGEPNVANGWFYTPAKVS